MSLGNGNPKEGDKGSNFNYELKVLQGLEAIAVAFENPKYKVYKVYTALLTQSGSDDPVATVMENTLEGSIVWTRSGAGNFWGTLNGAFTNVNKVFLTASNSFPSNVKDLSFYRLNNDICILYNANATGTLEDEMSVFIEIRVYN